jgi:hypothetical protein
LLPKSVFLIHARLLGVLVFAVGCVVLVSPLGSQLELNGQFHAASHERWRNAMRVAALLSSFFLLCGIAAFFGLPAIGFNGEAIDGARGLITGLMAAAVPLIVVVAWRNMSRK